MKHSDIFFEKSHCWCLETKITALLLGRLKSWTRSFNSTEVILCLKVVSAEHEKSSPCLLSSHAYLTLREKLYDTSRLSSSDLIGKYVADSGIGIPSPSERGYRADGMLGYSIILYFFPWWSLQNLVVPCRNNSHECNWKLLHMYDSTRFGAQSLSYSIILQFKIKMIHFLNYCTDNLFLCSKYQFFANIIKLIYTINVDIRHYYS